MIKYYILDCETTGVNPNYHEIIELSIMDFDSQNQISKQIKASFPRRYDNTSLRITGRRPEDLYRGMPKDRAIEMMDDFLNQDGLSPRERCVIAFVAHFDRNFCYNAWKSVSKTFQAENWLDAQKLAREMAKKQGLVKPKFNLENCLKIAGVTAVPGAHTASGDVKNTHSLVQKAIESGLDLISLTKHVPQIEGKKVEAGTWAELIEFEEADQNAELDLDIPQY